MTAPAAVASPHGPADELSAIDLVAPLVRRWRLIAATAVAFAVATAIVLLFVPPVFKARTSFTPESSSSLSSSSLAGLIGLAGQLGGLGNMPSGGNITPEFFQKLLSSRELLEEALTSRFPDPEARGAQRPLIDILKVEGDTPAERTEKALRALQRKIDVDIDKSTSVVTIEVGMRSPQLAAAVANRLVELLNRFNLERRQSQSRMQREFTGQRLRVAEQELRGAEQAQEAFLSHNRSYGESPLLVSQAQRLDRTVRVKQEVYLTLTKAFEEARIAEVRDTPVLTVIDPAVPPARRSSPKRLFGALVAAFLGSMVGAATVYLVEFRTRVRAANQPAIDALTQAWVESRAGAGEPVQRGAP